MGACCSNDNIDRRRYPRMPYYKFSIIRALQYPRSSPLPSQIPKTPYYIIKDMHAFSGAKPVILNMWFKQTFFRDDKRGLKAKADFYKGADAIVIELDLLEAKSLKELQHKTLPEIREAQCTAQDDGKDLMVVLLCKNAKFDPSKPVIGHSEGLDVAKAEKYAENKDWVIMLTQSGDDFLEDSYRQICEKLGDIGMQPKQPDNLEDSGLSIYDDDEDTQGRIKKKKKKNKRFHNLAPEGLENKEISPILPEKQTTQLEVLSPIRPDSGGGVGDGWDGYGTDEESDEFVGFREAEYDANLEIGATKRNSGPLIRQSPPRAADDFRSNGNLSPRDMVFGGPGMGQGGQLVGHKSIIGVIGRGGQGLGGGMGLKNSSVVGGSFHGRSLVGPPPPALQQQQQRYNY